MNYKVRAGARRVNVTAVICRLVTEAPYKLREMLVLFGNGAVCISPITSLRPLRILSVLCGLRSFTAKLQRKPAKSAKEKVAEILKLHHYLLSRGMDAGLRRCRAGKYHQRQRVW